MTSPSTAPTPVRRRIRVGLWTAISLALAILFVIAISVIDDSSGRPLFESALLSQTLSTIAILGAAFGPAVYATRQDTKIVRHEVKNDHTTNLRVENDSRHAETLRLFSEIRADFGGLRSEIRNDREAVREGFKELNGHIRRHDAILKTRKGRANG